MENFQDYLYIKEAAEFLGVARDTLRNWERHRRLIPHRHPINGYRLYRRRDLEALLAQIAPGARQRRMENRLQQASERQG